MVPEAVVYSIKTAAAAPRIGASSLASAVGAMARPVEVEVVAEVLVVTRVVAERVVAGMVVAALVVWLLVVPGMVVAGSVVADSTVLMVVVTGMVVVKVVLVTVPLVSVPVVAVLVSLEAMEEASERMLLAMDEASERMLEATALPDARADETAADTDEIRGGTLWAMASPDRRPKATRTKVWGFMVNDWMLSSSGVDGRRGREKEECEWTLGERMTYMLVFIYMLYIWAATGAKGGE